MNLISVVVVANVVEVQFMPLSTGNFHKFATAISQATATRWTTRVCHSQLESTTTTTTCHKTRQAVSEIYVSLSGKEVHSENLAGCLYIWGSDHGSCWLSAFWVGVEWLIISVIMCHWYACRSGQLLEITPKSKLTITLNKRAQTK